MFQYRVGTYEAISKMDGIDFELWYGSDVPNTKLKNYKGEVSFRHKQLPCWHLPVKTNNGSSSQPFFPFLYRHVPQAYPRTTGLISYGTILSTNKP